MRYLLLITGNEEEYSALPEPPGCGTWTEDMTERGVLKHSEGLRPVADATTVRVRGDEVLLTDGPFAETKDQVGGLSIIECEDLDEAIQIAAAHPSAAYGAIEVRPLL
jgi:hypothetical protein